MGPWPGARFGPSRPPTWLPPPVRPRPSAAPAGPRSGVATSASCPGISSTEPDLDPDSAAGYSGSMRTALFLSLLLITSASLAPPARGEEISQAERSRTDLGDAY